MNFKAKFLVGICALMTSLSALAFFNANPSVTVLPLQITAQVYNPYYEPIACRGQVFGRTAYGQVLTSFFPQQIIPPGQVRFAYIYSNVMNPFTNGYGNVVCNFLRPF
jgi:hypothetical protein